MKKIELTELEISVAKRVAADKFIVLGATEEELLAIGTLADKIEELHKETGEYEESAENPCEWLLEKYEQQKAEKEE